MSPKARHIIVGIVWVIASFIALGISLRIFGFFIFTYLANDRGVKLPPWFGDAFLWGSVTSYLVVPVIAAELALHSCLPGTGNGKSKRRGFAVETPQTSDSARLADRTTPPRV